MSARQRELVDAARAIIESDGGGQALDAPTASRGRLLRRACGRLASHTRELRKGRTPSVSRGTGYTTAFERQAGVFRLSIGAVKTRP